MLLWVGAVVCGYLGYKLYEWWVPATVAGLMLAGQAALGGRNSPLELLALSLLMNLVMFHATFAIGRTIGQRRDRRRKGVR